MGAEPWGLYPPEINAGRYESGIGPGAWVLAAAEWGVHAAMVAETLAAMGVQTGVATGNWEGLAARSFGAASVPFINYLLEMETMAITNATANAEVVSAWVSGHSSMVPLPVIIANRVAARTAQVIGVLGAPNTEMVRLELEYSAMWAHNAAVMTGYDIAANTATAVKPVPLPPPLVIDGTPVTAAAANTTQQMVQQGQQAMGGSPMRSMGSPGGFGNSFARPSLMDTSRWSQMMGSGAGSRSAFGGGGGGGGSAGGGSGGFSGGVSGAEAFSALRPPVASFAAPSPTMPTAAAPAFSGVSNSPSMTRGPMPMSPMNGMRGRGNSEESEQSQPLVMAAYQEFPINAQPETGNVTEMAAQDAIPDPQTKPSSPLQ